MVGDILSTLKKLVEWQRVVAAADKVPDLERRIALLELRIGSAPALPTCPGCAIGRWRKVRSERDPVTGALGGLRVTYACTVNCGYTETKLET